MNIIIGCDHAGFELKERIKQKMSSEGFIVKDAGTYSADPVDYPDFAHAVAEIVSSGEAEKGILICGSANGVAMAANKHKDIRAAICWNDEIARLARQHNNANIICIPARFVSSETAERMTDIFFSTAFEGGRHQKRVQKINC
ncbi:MAG: ribose 5-phosphate isomerase B [Bacteroidia bacterium]|nr:ribose 5-phosphate isomerase B [Bacteroidia bacterium]